MDSNPRNRASRVLRIAIATVLMLTGLASPALAVAKDKAMYVGGTTDFPRGGLGARVHPSIFGEVDVSKVEGRCDLRSPSQFVFDAGGNDTLHISYEAIDRLTYGLTVPDDSPRGVFLITWDPLDQFTDRAHYLLSIVFHDQAGKAQLAVLELGRDLVQPTLAALETRAGKAVDFTDVGACLRYRPADQCNFGTPAELKGLTKVFVDAGPDPEFRSLIVSEIEKGQLHLEFLPVLDGAEIVLEFHGEKFHRPDALQALHGGRGHVYVARDSGWRPVMQFAGTRTGAWGAKPAAKFGQAFCQSYRQANLR